MNLEYEIVSKSVVKLSINIADFAKFPSYQQKNAVVNKIWGVGCINLALFKHLKVKVPHVSSANTANFRLMVFFTPPAFESLEKA